VKDELRSTMGDKRLNGLMLTAVKKNTVKDLRLADICGYVCFKIQKKLKLQSGLE